jgi:hypothetical protein
MLLFTLCGVLNSNCDHRGDRAKLGGHRLVQEGGGLLGLLDLVLLEVDDVDSYSSDSVPELISTRRASTGVETAELGSVASDGHRPPPAPAT